VSESPTTPHGKIMLWEHSRNFNFEEHIRFQCSRQEQSEISV
jgi:hypothetical protein